MFFFFLQNVQPNFLLLMVVFLLFSFVKFHFCHISSEVFLLLYFFYSYGLCSIARGTLGPQWLCLHFRGVIFCQERMIPV